MIQIPNKRIHSRVRKVRDSEEMGVRYMQACTIQEFMKEMKIGKP